MDLENKIIKSLQFLMVQGSLNPNITFVGEKMWQTDTHKSEYRGFQAPSDITMEILYACTDMYILYPLNG